MGRKKINDIQKANNITISPRNEKQKEYLNAIKSYDQIFAIGPAGSGKTFVPTMYAIEAYLRGEIDKIIVTRPAVEVEESHGYLPGIMEKKLAPWVLPITELIEEALGSKQRFIDMQKSGEFEIAPFAYMRGRTFNNAFVILDEAQNTSVKQMEMFLTRIGDNTKVIVSGDVRQTDRETNNSGLIKAVEMVKKHSIPAPVIEFTAKEVVRSKMCRIWVEAFEKE